MVSRPSVSEPLQPRKRVSVRQIGSHSKRARVSETSQKQERSFEKLPDNFNQFFEENDLFFTNNLIWPNKSYK
jgi:hypothetical protein